MASAHGTVVSRLAVREALPRDASDEEKQRCDDGVAQARLIKANEQQKADAAVDAEERAWANRIEISEAAEVRAARLEAEAKGNIGKAQKRKADTQVQAQQAVMMETIASAAKRQTVAADPPPAPTIEAAAPAPATVTETTAPAIEQAAPEAAMVTEMTEPAARMDVDGGAAATTTGEAEPVATAAAAPTPQHIAAVAALFA